MALHGETRISLKKKKKRNETKRTREFTTRTDAAKQLFRPFETLNGIFIRLPENRLNASQFAGCVGFKVNTVKKNKRKKITWKFSLKQDARLS